MKRARERLDQLAERYRLDPAAAPALERLLAALATEPDPHTSVADPTRAVDQHIADSLSGLEVEELRSARAIADLGAGAGFPGLPLAVALPSTAVDLIESTGRKCAVIRRLAEATAVGRAEVACTRAEDWAGGEGAERYDVVTVRALAPLAVLVEYSAPLLRAGGVLVAWKGARDAGEERAGAAAAGQVGMTLREVRHVQPFARAHSRHLHVFAKTGPAPPELPRRPGMAVKRPLA